MSLIPFDTCHSSLLDKITLLYVWFFTLLLWLNRIRYPYCSRYSGIFDFLLVKTRLRSALSVIFCFVKTGLHSNVFFLGIKGARLFIMVIKMPSDTNWHVTPQSDRDSGIQFSWLSADSKIERLEVAYMLNTKSMHLWFDSSSSLDTCHCPIGTALARIFVIITWSHRAKSRFRYPNSIY